MLYRIIASAAIVVVGFAVRALAGASIRRNIRKKRLKSQSALLARKLATAFIVIAVIVMVGFVWGVGPKTIWVSLTSIIALVVIGFFAVWCMLSNIVAGFILLMSRPFGVGDEIVLLPENIRGTVTNITVMFLILEDDEGATVTIPNNLVFQRIVKRLKKADAD